MSVEAYFAEALSVTALDRLFRHEVRRAARDTTDDEALGQDVRRAVTAYDKRLAELTRGEVS